MQDAKRLPELVAKIHGHAHDEHRRDASTDTTEPWRAPHQEKAQGTKRGDSEHHDPNWPIIPLQETTLAVATVTAVAVSRIQGVLAAPAIPGMTHTTLKGNVICRQGAGQEQAREPGEPGEDLGVLLKPDP